MAKTEAASIARITNRPPAKYNGMAKSGSVCLVQSNETVAFFASPKSISATALVPSSVEVLLICRLAVPFPHEVFVHISESCTATWLSDWSAVPWAAAFCVDSADQSDSPVIRVYGVPAIQPATSRADPMTMHTFADASEAFAVMFTRLSIRESTPGSVTT